MSMLRRITSLPGRLQNAVFDGFAIPGVRRERISKALIERHLPAEPVIVDCGAHDGADTVDMARRWPNARIFAFEPVPAVFARLAAKTMRLPNVRCFPLAIAESVGTREMHFSSGSSDASSSLLAPATHLDDHPSVHFATTGMVQTTTFDRWASAEGIERVDMLWLDMQGYELDALKASPRLLATVRVIHTEVCTKELYRGVALYPELRGWIESQGFRLVVEAIPPGWDAGNVLFVRP